MNIKTIIFSFILLTSSQIGLATSHFAYYLLKGYTGDKAVLYSIKGSQNIAVDTAYRQSTGAVVFQNIEKYPAGMYRIYFNDSLYTEVIFNNEDIVLESDVKNVITNMKVKKSIENQILFDYWNFALRIRDSITTLSFEKDKIEKSTYNSNHPKIIAINKRIKQFNYDLRNYVINKKNEYPNNFAPKLLQSYLFADYEEYQKNHPDNKYKDENSFYYDHYFDNIDFSDARFINTKVFYVSISDYLRTFGEPASTKNYLGIIDQVMTKASANKDVYIFCLNLFMQTFENSIWEDVMVQLIDKYYVPSGYYPPQMTAYYAGMANKIRSLKPGQEAPDIILKDINGDVQNMKQIKAKAKILVFYSSDCSHCKEALPGLIDLYNMYRGKGLEGFGIALDDNIKKWKSEVKKQKLDWINLSDLKGLNSPLIKTYNISSTPTIIILNEENKIMAKPKDMGEAHAALLQLLN